MELGNPSNTGHFDRRAATYDRDDEVHQRVMSLLVAGTDVKPGFRILDIATGTGLLALEVARHVGADGRVTGIDVSKGMLDEARRKADAAGLQNIDFVLADAERLALPRGSFDCVFCSSALVLMEDIPGALRLWFELLKPGGRIAFDAPARPFGVAEVIADVAAAHGVRLAYADVADTAEKCRSLLEGAGFEVVAVKRELTDSSFIELEKAIAFFDSHLDHPAWRALNQAPSQTREAIRSGYVDRVRELAVGGKVASDTALHLAFGRK